MLFEEIDGCDFSHVGEGAKNDGWVEFKLGCSEVFQVKDISPSGFSNPPGVSFSAPIFRVVDDHDILQVSAFLFPEKSTVTSTIFFHAATSGFKAWTDIFRDIVNFTGAIEITVPLVFFQQSFYQWFLHLVEVVSPETGEVLNPLPDFLFQAEVEGSMEDPGIVFVMESQDSPTDRANYGFPFFLGFFQNEGHLTDWTKNLFHAVHPSKASLMRSSS